MASFREARELIHLCYEMDYISDEEFLLLHAGYKSQNLELPYDSFPEFDLDSFHEDECLAHFRFQKIHIPVLAEALQIPPTVRCSQGSVCDGEEALCMLLKRMCYPCRYSDMVPLFAKPVPVISMMTNEVLDYIYATQGHRILQWNHQLLSPRNLEHYADSIHSKGAPLDNCFGFVDGTVRPISRPECNQRIVYNGHKRVHAIKFQSVVTPNGMIANLFGPVGRYFSNSFVHSHVYVDLHVCVVFIVDQ